MKEPGCEQFEVFKVRSNPDRLACWSAGPTKPLSTLMPNERHPTGLAAELRAGGGEREDY